ncbi:MAG: cobalamin-dependent protein [Pseudomonadota bacterium]|nr:cobalamin-dependent protein [Pseudomonadota bacterium]
MTHRLLFIKPPDRFLENEFVYQQLGPHYLQSFLLENGIESDLLVLYERPEARKARESGESQVAVLDDLNMLYLGCNGETKDAPFDVAVIGDYDIVGLSVMSPQAPDAYLLSEAINRRYPGVTTVIGGSHPRYYQDQVMTLHEDIAFDFIVPQDGWQPMLDIASGQVNKGNKSTLIVDNMSKLTALPPPSRPVELMQRYRFEIAGAPAFHTVSALGCPFTCHFCESGIESVRRFSTAMIDRDLSVMAGTHDQIGNAQKSVMFFDDVGLMNPKQVAQLAELVCGHGFDTWRAFTHAYLVRKFRGDLLEPFVTTGGRRVGMGLETGSQRSLDLINKRNGKQQLVSDHYEAVRIANAHGIAVDAFTMIFPWEDEDDLCHTTALIEFIADNKVEGTDARGRTMRNHVDSTIMTPYQGTKFYDLFRAGQFPAVEVNPDVDPGSLYYKGNLGGSGWPYARTRLPRAIYEQAQTYRNSLRPEFR